MTETASPAKMVKRAKRIPVTDLRIGMRIATQFNPASRVVSRDTVVKEINACQSRGNVHVNGSDCYSLISFVNISV